jgi:hypothetical protein
MANGGRYPSYIACVAQVLSASTQPLSVDALLSHIKERRPITKGARSAVYRAIGQLFQAVPVAPSSYGWLSTLLTGNTFRHLLTAEEVRRGFLMLDELEHAVFFPQFFQTYQPDERKLQIELFGGPVIEAEAYIERKTWSLRLGTQFAEWIDEAGCQGRDDILIQVHNATTGEYSLRLQPRELRDLNSIQGRNIQLALLAEEIVSEDRRARTSIPTAELAARIIGRGFFKETLPPDDFHYVLHQYSLLRFHNGAGYSLDLEAVDFATNLSSSEALFTNEEALAYAPAWEPYDDETTFEQEMAELPFWDDDLDDDLLAGSCASYDAYVESYHDAESVDELLSHTDFHLLEAELETLLTLEQEFGYLLPEQITRKHQLIDRLFIDPETLLDNDTDMPDYPDFDEPPFWEN